MKPALRLLACRRCHTPVIETTDPILIRCELTHLTPEAEAHAWLAGRRTYSVRTLGTEQHLIRRFCSPETARATVAHLVAGTAPDLTVLALHACPGAGPHPVHLADWRPEDRRFLFPPPRPAIPEEPPY